jgi:glutamine synthetase
MLLMPDPTAYIDPFYEEPTLVLTCDVIEPPTARATTATRARSPSAPKPT